MTKKKKQPLDVYEVIAKDWKLIDQILAAKGDRLKIAKLVAKYGHSGMQQGRIQGVVSMERLLTPRIGYMDYTDYEDELSRADDGIEVFLTPRGVDKGRRCAKECGIVQVEVRLLKIERRPLPYEKRKTYPLSSLQTKRRKKK